MTGPAKAERRPRGEAASAGKLADQASASVPQGRCAGRGCDRSVRNGDLVARDGQCYCKRCADDLPPWARKPPTKRAAGTKPVRRTAAPGAGASAPRRTLDAARRAVTAAEADWVRLKAPGSTAQQPPEALAALGWLQVARANLAAAKGGAR